MLSPNKSLYLPEGLGIPVDENLSSDFQQFNQYLDEALNSPTFEDSQLGLFVEEKSKIPVSQKSAQISKNLQEQTNVPHTPEAIPENSTISSSEKDNLKILDKNNLKTLGLNNLKTSDKNNSKTSEKSNLKASDNTNSDKLKTPPRYHPRISQNHLGQSSREHNFKSLPKTHMKNYPDNSYANIQNTTPPRPTFKFQNEGSNSTATNKSGTSSVDESDDSSEYFQLNIANDTSNTISATEVLTNNFSSPSNNNSEQNQQGLRTGSSSNNSHLVSSAFKSESSKNFPNYDEIEDLDKPIQFDGSYESYVNIKQVLTSINENTSPDKPNFNIEKTFAENNSQNQNNVNQLYDIEELDDEYDSNDDSFSNSDNVEILEIRRKNTILKLPINSKEFKDYEGFRANPLPKSGKQHTGSIKNETINSANREISKQKNPISIIKVGSFEETFEDTTNTSNLIEDNITNVKLNKSMLNEKSKLPYSVPYPTFDESYPSDEELTNSKIIPIKKDFDLDSNDESKDIERSYDSSVDEPFNSIQASQKLDGKFQDDILPYPTHDDAATNSYKYLEIKGKHESTSTITTSTTLNSRSNSTKNTNSMGSIITNNKLQEAIFSSEQFKTDEISTPSNFDILNQSEVDDEDLDTPKLTNFHSKSTSSMVNNIGSESKEKQNVPQKLFSNNKVLIASQEQNKKDNLSATENFWPNDPWKYYQYNPNISEHGSTIQTNPKYYDSASSINGTLNFSKILANDTTATSNSLLKDRPAILGRSSNIFDVDNSLTLSAPKFEKSPNLSNAIDDSFLFSSQIEDSNIAIENQDLATEVPPKLESISLSKEAKADIHHDQQKPEQRTFFSHPQNERLQQSVIRLNKPNSTALNIAPHLPLSKQYYSSSMRSPNNILSPNSMKSPRNMMSPNSPNYPNNFMSPNSLKSPNSSRSPNFLKSPILDSQIDEEIADMVLMNKNFFVTYNGERTNDLYKTASKNSMQHKNSNISGGGMSYQRYKSAVNYSKNSMNTKSKKEDQYVNDASKSKDLDKRESTMSVATANNINQKSIIDIYNNMQQNFPPNNTNIKSTTILENKEAEFESLVVSPKDISKIELGLEELSLFERQKRMSEMTITTVTHRNTLDSRDFVDPPSVANVLFNSASAGGGTFNMIDKYFSSDRNMPVISSQSKISNSNPVSPVIGLNIPQVNNENNMYPNNVDPKVDLLDGSNQKSNPSQNNKDTEKKSKMYQNETVTNTNGSSPFGRNQSHLKKQQKTYIRNSSSQFNNVQRNFSNSSSFLQHVTPRNLNNKSSRMTMESRQLSMKSANTFASKYHPADISTMPSIHNSAYMNHLQNSNSIYTEETDDVSSFESASIMSDGASTIIEMNMNRGKSMRAVSYDDLPNANVGEMYRQLSFYEKRDDYD